MSDVRVNRSLTIPENELELRFSTSGGPGGQHANKAATRVELAWNVDRSSALSERQRARIRHRLSNRIDASGTIRVAADNYRSQLRNRAAAEARLGDLIRGALRVQKQRRPTAPSQAAVERRLQAKRRHADKKRARRDLGESD